jgi:hypothetical protein
MKTVFLAVTIFVLFLTNATGQGKSLTDDPLTGLPRIPATDSRNHIGNGPTQMPDGQVCKSKMQGNFYSLHDIKTDAVVQWYASHLSGFKKVQGYENGRSQAAFYNSDRTLLIIVTGESGAKGENTNAYAVAYERYQPGLSERTVTGMTQGNVDCR